MTIIRYKQQIGGSKGQIVKLLEEDGIYVWVRNIKNKFEFRVKGTDFRKYYKEVKMKKKGEKDGRI